MLASVALRVSIGSRQKFPNCSSWLACYLRNPPPAELGIEAHMRVLVLAAITAISIGMLGLPRASAMPASGIAVSQAAAAANLSQTVRWWRYRRWHRWHRWHWRRW
jgi:hypothetical protein